MRILRLDQLTNAAQGVNPLDGHATFFVELWYSMTHQRSLDSYRVKCLNSRMMMRELAEELSLGIIKVTEIQSLAAEILDCLTNDPVVQNHFGHHFGVIKPFLTDPPQAEKDEKKEERKDKDDKKREREAKVKEFEFIADDFHAALESNYWPALRSELVAAVPSGDRDRTRLVLSHTIADLIDRGWPAETLFRWHDHFLSEVNRAKYSFEKNLSYMLKFLSRPPQEYEVTLRLTGSSNVLNLQEYGTFTFMDKVGNLEGAPQRFVTPAKNVCFAQTVVRDTDFVSAAINAKEQFEQFIDLLRFDYEPYLLKVDQKCHVKRLPEGKVEWPQVKAMIPNPSSDSDHSTFASFISGLKALSLRPETEESSRRKIRGAIRQYRFGRDSDNYKDKFLYWWMGLESVASMRGDSIGESVAKNVSRVMALPYLSRLLGDALGTMNYLPIDWPADLRSFCSGKDLKDVTVRDLLRIIHSETHRTMLLEACTKTPTMHYRCQQLFAVLSDPAKTLLKLEEHVRHLEWQLARLYRIRCCIVHGSEVRFRLSLFAANLEYYLKETVKFLIAGFNDNSHIHNLEEVFYRSTIAYNRAVAGLKAANAGPAEISQAVLSNIVVKLPVA